MYAGHFAAGLAIKAKEPGLPTWAVLFGVGFVDVLFGAFVLAGLERVSITPGQAPGFRLDFIDWSHSLAMSILWAGVYGLCFVRRGARIAVGCAAAVFSHFVLDYLMHPGDLALWPHSSAHVGIGLWTAWPRGWWWFELAFILACGAYYLSRARRLGGFGGRGAAALAVVLLLHLSNAPWFAPKG